MDRNELIEEIVCFCKEAGWNENTFGIRASNDSDLMRRLRLGVVSLRIVERVEKFLSDEHAKRKEAAK